MQRLFASWGRLALEFEKRTRVNDTELLHYAVSRKVFRVDE